MRINDLKLGQGIGLISEKAQTSAQMFAKLFNSEVNERVKGEPGEAAEVERWSRPGAGLLGAVAYVGLAWL